VENGPATGERPGVPGTGHGLTGLRERVEARSGRLTAAPTANGGWLVQADLPQPGPSSGSTH